MRKASINRLIVVAVCLAAVLLIASLTLDSGGKPIELSKENLKSALFERPAFFGSPGPLRYRSEDDWTWECERLISYFQDTRTRGTVLVRENGIRPVGFGAWGNPPRYERTRRTIEYKLRRDSLVEDWYIDTSAGVAIRKWKFLKIYLKLDSKK